MPFKHIDNRVSVTCLLKYDKLYTYFKWLFILYVDFKN